MTRPKLPLRDPIEFLKYFKEFDGSARRAAMRMFPELSVNAASNKGEQYLAKLDPYKVFLPRLGRRKTKFMTDVIESAPQPREVILKPAEKAQMNFAALFEKHGGDGMKSAMAAVRELHPTWRRRAALMRKAREYLSKSEYIFTLLNALEAAGVTAEMTAEKIKELLQAKRVHRTIIKGDLVEEIEEIDSTAMDKGISHALKAGIGGGYAPERSLIGIKDFSLKNALREVEKEENKEWRKGI